MQTLYLSLASLISMVLLTVIGNGHNEPLAKNDDRPAMWRQVEQARSQQLPKTANDLLTKIYDSAVAEEDFDDAIKALCFRIRIDSEINQPALPYAIRKLQAELPTLPDEVRPLAEVIQANWMLGYFHDNRWQFAQRAQTGEPVTGDFETWDLPRILGEIDQHLQAALSAGDQLKQTPITKFDKLLEKGTLPDTYQPTLFDFVTRQAAGFYALDEHISRSQDASEIKSDSPIFSDVDSFLGWNLKASNIYDPSNRGIKIYQDLLRFHAADKDPTARLDADLNRLIFGHRIATGDEDGNAYCKALQRFADQNIEHELSSLALYRLAMSFRSADELVKAHEVATIGKNRFPQSNGGKLCLQAITNLERPELSISTEKIWNGDSPELRVDYKNLEKVHFRLIPFDYRTWSWGGINDPQNSFRRKGLDQLLGMTPAPRSTWSVDLPATNDFKYRTDILPTKIQTPPGSYLLVASQNADFSQDDNILSMAHVWISDLNLVTRNQTRIASGQVLDAQAGTPVAGAKVSVYGWQHNNGQLGQEIFVGSAVTNDEGIYVVPTSKDAQHMVYVESGNQKLGVIDNVSGQTRTNRANKNTFLFTDRSIYRPGQTIRFKGICVSSNKLTNEYKTLPGQTISISLLDPNDQVIEKRDFQCNEFGSCSGSFEAPAERGTGGMYLQVTQGPSGYAYVSVEEYKRPKFYVQVKKPDKQIRLEQPVDVTVKATGYTGAPVGGAKVSWRVVRDVRYPSWWYYRCWFMPPQGNSKEIASGTGTTSADGEFTVNFVADPDRSVGREIQPSFTYTVYADVTDGAGETRSASENVVVGYTLLTAYIESNEWLTTDKPVELKLQVDTLLGVGQPTAGRLTVFKLKNPEEVQRHQFSNLYDGNAVALSDFRSWDTGNQVETFEITTDAEGAHKTKIRLAAGAYKAIFKTTDEAGREVLAELPFQVFDLAAKNMLVKMPSTFQAKSWSVEPGEAFEAIWGTGYDSGRAYVEIEHRGKIVSAYWTDADRTQQPIQFAVKEKHRGGFQIRLTFVRENRAYIESKTVEVPWSNKQLKIKWEHFVSKLTPGGKETWTAVITGPDAKQHAVEMVAGLYDASLDAFSPHAWSNPFEGLFYRDSQISQVRYHNQSLYLADRSSSHRPQHKPIIATYRRFNSQIAVDFFSTQVEELDDLFSFDDPFLSGQPFSDEEMIDERLDLGDLDDPLFSDEIEGGIQPYAQNFSMVVSVSPEDAMSRLSFMSDGESEGFENRSVRNANRAVDLDRVSARVNLKETAFFYPQLTADDDGAVRVEFTIPEALTEWKFLALAHDNDLRAGLLTDTATTSKDLMVQPNPPRFLREGDQLEFSVRITNRSEQPQTGKIRLTLADAASDKDLNDTFGNQANEKPFEVPAGQSVSVFWKLSVPDYVGVLTWKAIGGTKTLSDGEEGFLPVLSKQILVIESLPLPIRGKQTKQFSFDRLDMMDTSETIKSESLTVQMTSNPTWYAVMALPYLMEYPHQCNEQVFNRIYANALSRHIVTSNPQIKRVFDQWRSTPVLDGPLEKNDDLLNLVIAETPWLLDAKQESQARRDVAILFDENRIQNELQQAMRQLSQSQYTDGSWSWFPGGPANDFITLYITTGFGRLRQLGVTVDQQPAFRSLQRLDGWIHQRYQRLRENGNLDRNNLSPMDCLYLYGRSFFLTDRAIADQHRTAMDYFLNQAKTHWTGMGKMSQGQLCVALKRFKDDETSTAILKSLTERSQSSEEMGRHWQESEERWWWYRAPIETQAMLIEAYAEVANDQVAVEDCKVWLLKQKQTQNWPTTKSTADAIYALLLRGTDRLASTQLVEVSLGGVPIKPEGVEIGTGFYWKKFVGEEVKSSLKNIVVKKSDDGVAWGSVHWKYLEDVANLKPYEGTPLQLTKALFIKKNTKAGPTITAIEGPVEVGDEVVTRVEIRVDRDMEYVHLKDQRASGTEPVNVLSKYKRQNGLSYYESTRDTASHFFIDYLPRGTYVFEYSVRVQHRGNYPSGIATLECMYAPEFNSHSNSVNLEVR